MLIDITEDKRFLIIREATTHELTQMRTSFTKEVPGSFVLKRKNPWIETERCFINEYGLMPFGLWTEAIKVAKEYRLDLRFSDELNAYISNDPLPKEVFVKYVNELFEGATNEKGEPFKPYDYQVDAAYALLNYKRCCAEISTSGGKTLIAFIMFKYLIDVLGCKRVLYVVPSKDLGTQSAEKFELYESFLKKKTKSFTCGTLKSGLNKKEKALVETCTILFGTFQSLCNKEADFFPDFEAHIGDECHHYAGSKSLRNILQKARNLKYSFGVTGTLPKEKTYDHFMIQSMLGPVVYKFTANQLINEEKTGTPIHIVFEILDYASLEEKAALFSQRLNAPKEDIRAGANNLMKEQDFVNSSYKRLNYICDLAVRAKKNTLILFGDIKGGYGRRIMEKIKSMTDAKKVFYADGTTPEENRNYYKSEMENSDNVVMVASIGTFGEGIDIKNLWNIFLVNTCKSNRLVRQIVGRGLRPYPGKEMTLMMDFVDDLRVKDPKKGANYMWKHYLERKKIYEEQKFPTYEHNIVLEDNDPLI